MFLALVHHAEFVVSNSFHATAFSLIFHKQFVVFNRSESINTRMRDLAYLSGTGNRLISQFESTNLEMINYGLVQHKLDSTIENSKDYIAMVLGAVK